MGADHFEKLTKQETGKFTYDHLIQIFEGMQSNSLDLTDTGITLIHRVSDVPGYQHIEVIMKGNCKFIIGLSEPPGEPRAVYFIKRFQYQERSDLWRDYEIGVEIREDNTRRVFSCKYNKGISNFVRCSTFDEGIPSGIRERELKKNISSISSDIDFFKARA